MKTAMQELKESLQSINERYQLKDDANWLMNEVLDLVENSLEKEKEQIKDFHVMLMKKGLEQEGNEIEWDYDELKKEAEDYYNQTYNQKQHIIDIIKTDEDDGLYNQLT